MLGHKILNKEHIEVLRSIQRVVHKTAIIAGGAVRDMVMDKPYRDIDIWANTGKSNKVTKAVEYVLPRVLKFADGDFLTLAYNWRGEEKRDVRWDRATGFTHSNPYHDKPIKSMLNMKFRGDDYQLILIEHDPTDFVKKFFDVGFCQVWHDGEQVVETPEFKKDKEEKTFTLNADRMKKDAYDVIVATRIPRLNKKYPDFKLVTVGKVEERAKVKYGHTVSSTTGTVRLQDGWAQWDDDNIRDETGVVVQFGPNGPPQWWRTDMWLPPVVGIGDTITWPNASMDEAYIITHVAAFDPDEQLVGNLERRKFVTFEGRWAAYTRFNGRWHKDISIDVAEGRR